MSLQDFIATHRDEIIERARVKVSSRKAPPATAPELVHGVPLFLTQLGDILRQEVDPAHSDASEMGESAVQHGRELLERGFTIAQVVHDYGDVCQAVTELALTLKTPITTKDFHTLNLCLDNAIAFAVTEYSRQETSDASITEAKRQGFFVHELRNRLSAAMLALEALKTGRVGVTGSTMLVLERNLASLLELINHRISEVRFNLGTNRRQRLSLAGLIDEMETNGSLEAAARGLRFEVEREDQDVEVNVDRQLFTSAVANLLQNAFKFTRPATRVRLRVRATADRVWIDVEDQCGGLHPGVAEGHLPTSGPWGTDRSGLGLGLIISRQAIEALDGTLSVRNLPGQGCVFTVELPRTLTSEPVPHS